MSALNTILGTAPSGTTPATITRYSGGLVDLHPLITGYWIFAINKPPNMLGSKFAGAVFQKWFLTTAEGFTPPSRTLNKVDVPGQGGISSSFITGQMLNRTFTTTHREYSGMRMTTLVNAWTQIVDEKTGMYPKGEADIDKTLTGKAYKGSAWVVLLKPQLARKTDKLDEDDVEYAYHFDGVWPETDPAEAMNSDISGNDSVQINVTWNFDGWPDTTTNQSSGHAKLAIEALVPAKAEEISKKSGSPGGGGDDTGE